MIPIFKYGSTQRRGALLHHQTPHSPNFECFIAHVTEVIEWNVKVFNFVLVIDCEHCAERACRDQYEQLQNHIGAENTIRMVTLYLQRNHSSKRLNHKYWWAAFYPLYGSRQIFKSSKVHCMTLESSLNAIGISLSIRMITFIDKSVVYHFTHLSQAVVHSLSFFCNSAQFRRFFFFLNFKVDSECYEIKSVLEWRALTLINHSFDLDAIEKKKKW